MGAVTRTERVAPGGELEERVAELEREMASLRRALVALTESARVHDAAAVASQLAGRTIDQDELVAIGKSLEPDLDAHLKRIGE